MKFTVSNNRNYMSKNLLTKSGLILIVILLFIGNKTFAQLKVKENKTLSEKIFFGGGIGMVFGTVTRIDILPEVGMWVIPQWAVGLGGRYTFKKDRFNLLNGESKPYSTHIWGLSAFTQILPIPDLDEAFKIGIHGGPVFHGEWEGLYLDKGLLDPTIGSSTGKGWVHMFLVGGGYHFPMGEKAAINLLVLWDLTNSRYTPYTTNPLIRLSVNF